MNKPGFSWESFYRLPIVGIVRGLSMEEVKNILPIYQEAGLNTIEITMNTKNAAAIIGLIRLAYPAINTGAGTVCTKKELAEAMDAGAQFIVTPVTDKQIIGACVKNELPVFPGAYTPTEIHQAWIYGASMVKVYPAKGLGPGYIKDVKAPLNQVKLLPTGGIGLDEIDSYRAAGADGFGIGSPLFLQSMITEKNWKGLLEHFKKFVRKMQMGSAMRHMPV